MSVFAINGVQPFRCCEDWERAQEEGGGDDGDFELLICDLVYPVSYGALEQWLAAPQRPLGQWNLGSHLPPVRFCPWCGHPVPTPERMIEIVRGLLTPHPAAEDP